MFGHQKTAPCKHCGKQICTDGRDWATHPGHNYKCSRSSNGKHEK